METLVVVKQNGVSEEVRSFLATHGFEKEDRVFCLPNTDYWICPSEFDLAAITENLKTLDSDVGCMKIQNLKV